MHSTTYGALRVALARSGPLCNLEKELRVLLGYFSTPTGLVVAVFVRSKVPAVLLVAARYVGTKNPVEPTKIVCISHMTRTCTARKCKPPRLLPERTDSFCIVDWGRCVWHAVLLSSGKCCADCAGCTHTVVAETASAAVGGWVRWDLIAGFKPHE